MLQIAVDSKSEFKRRLDNHKCNPYTICDTLELPGAIRTLYAIYYVNLVIFEVPLELRIRANRYLQHFRPVFRNPYTIYSTWESLGSFWWAPISIFGRFGVRFWDSDGIFLAVFWMPSPNNAKNAKNIAKKFQIG